MIMAADDDIPFHVQVRFLNDLISKNQSRLWLSPLCRSVIVQVSLLLPLFSIMLSVTYLDFISGLLYQISHLTFSYSFVLQFGWVPPDIQNIIN